MGHMLGIICKQMDQVPADTEGTSWVEGGHKINQSIKI